MARILFTLPRFHTNMWFAVRQMLEDGHKVCLLVNTASSTEDHSLVTPKVLGKYPSREEVRLAVEEFAPDLVVVRNSWAISRRAARVARMNGIPQVLYNQIVVEQPTSLLRRIILRYKGLPVHRITPARRSPEPGRADPYATYLPWPVGELPFAPMQKPAPDKLNVLLVGKLGTVRKNQDKLIEELEAQGGGKHLHLTLIGSPTREDNPHYQKLLRLSQLPWVDLAGTRHFTQVPAFYAAHDVCILPSFDEPLGTSPVEAMAYGCVPMISRQCGTSGYLSDGVDGCVIDPSDMAGTARRLIALAQDQTQLAALAAGARETYERDLSEKAFSRGFSDVLAGWLPSDTVR